VTIVIKHLYSDTHIRTATNLGHCQM